MEDKIKEPLIIEIDLHLIEMRAKNVVSFEKYIFLPGVGGLQRILRNLQGGLQTFLRLLTRWVVVSKNGQKLSDVIH